MANYEYRCQECGEQFSRSEHITEHAAPPQCPKCQSQKVQQLFTTPVYVQTSRKS